jgi:hypothetical protein
MKALGSTDGNFVDGLIGHIVNICAPGKEPDDRAINFVLSVIGGIEPKDQIEAMMAAQMAAIHSATMTLARRLSKVDNIPQQESASNALNKLARTYANQMEALKRYRTGGEQRVTVSHVTVQDGGQAIVGDVTGVGGLRKTAE